MKIYIGTDHTGYELKEKLKEYLPKLGLGYEVVDKGAFEYDKDDDYPDFVRPVAEAVAQDKESRGIIFGASGQGEAMCANRVKGVRAALFYGEVPRSQRDVSGKVMDIVTSTRMHNDANVLSLAVRFITFDEAKSAVDTFLSTKFSGDERHIRRINKLG